MDMEGAKAENTPKATFEPVDFALEKTKTATEKVAVFKVCAHRDSNLGPFA